MAVQDSARVDAASTPAIAALLAAGVPHSAHSYEHNPNSGVSYGIEAAQALGVEPARVFKTLCVTTADALALALVPVANSLDLKAVARALGAKRASMAEPAVAQRVTGYVVGGISPLGGRHLLPTVIDTSVFDHDEVYVSGGRRGLDIALAPSSLVECTRATTAPIAKES